MNSEMIKTLIEQRLSGAKADVESADNVHFSAVIIYPAFAGKSKVAQQQMVYAALQAEIASGDIHALSFKTYTPEAWAAAQV